MSKHLDKTIAVDLTPVLPSGENGGAKILTLTLIRSLARKAPRTQFVLLTQSDSHEELCALESSNVRCLMVRVSSKMHSKKHPWWTRIAKHILGFLPSRIQRFVINQICRLRPLWKRFRAAQVLKDINADLLFCPFTAPTYAEKSIPTICTIYDLQHKTYPQFFTLEDYLNRDQAFKNACRQATVLTVISDYSKQSVIQQNAALKEKLQVIYPRIAKRFDHGDLNDTSVLNRFGITAEKYLIYPANFWKHKNHEMLLTAFNLACQTGLPEDVFLVCTGTFNDNQKHLAHAVQVMGIGHRLIFTDFISENDLAVLMINSAGLIFPSLYEGFGMPVIEAMAAGIPVACSNVTALPEIAGKSALLFDPHIPTDIADAIIRLIKDHDLRSHGCLAGKEWATPFFDADRMTKEYYDLFESILNPTKNIELCT